MPEIKTISVSDCNLEEAEAGDIEQQICVAQAHLSNKDCEEAKLWAEKVWYQDNENEYDSLAVSDLMEILDPSGDCTDGNRGFWKAAKVVLGDIIPEDLD
jgi:hypothetical protein